MQMPSLARAYEGGGNRLPRPPYQPASSARARENEPARHKSVRNGHRGFQAAAEAAPMSPAGCSTRANNDGNLN